VFGTVALAGVWPFSGFFSKDGILALAAERNPGLFILGLLVAVLTAFYMFRLVFVVYGGASRSDSAGHAHESPQVMLWPLRILAVFSLIGGVLGLESLYERQFAPGEAGTHLSIGAQLIHPLVHAPAAAGLGLLAAAVGILGAYKLYARAAADPLPEKLGTFGRAIRNKFYFDELYEAWFIRPHDLLAAVANFFDRWVISGAVKFTHGTTEIAGRALRLLQTGNLQAYAFLFALGVALALYFVLGK
jgi:NADH-quinone oxidoreductase subunit L